MPRPAFVAPIPHPMGLPPVIHSLATSVVRHRHASSDILLVLADALDEVYHDLAQQEVAAPSIRQLASELRDRAPGYA